MTTEIKDYIQVGIAIMIGVGITYLMLQTAWDFDQKLHANNVNSFMFPLTIMIIIIAIMISVWELRSLFKVDKNQMTEETRSNQE